MSEVIPDLSSIKRFFSFIWHLVLFGYTIFAKNCIKVVYGFKINVLISKEKNFIFLGGGGRINGRGKTALVMINFVHKS